MDIIFEFDKLTKNYACFKPARRENVVGSLYLEHPDYEELGSPETVKVTVSAVTDVGYDDSNGGPGITDLVSV